MMMLYCTKNCARLVAAQHVGYLTRYKVGTAGAQSSFFKAEVEIDKGTEKQYWYGHNI